MPESTPAQADTSPRLLLVDDDSDLCALTSEFLETRGVLVETVGDGGEAVELALNGHYSLIILDVMLPTFDGFEVLRRLRASGASTANVPVVMLTAQGDEIDRIVGLELGADDYLPKPFNPRELLARIRAILRRAESTSVAPTAPASVEAAAKGGRHSPSHSPETQSGEQLTRSSGAGDSLAAELLDERWQYGDIEMDVAARAVWRAGAEVELTAVEFDLLKMLMRSAGRVVERDKLAMEALQRRLTPFDRSLDIHMSKLRRKLEPSNPIKTVRGIGYILAKPAAGKE